MALLNNILFFPPPKSKKKNNKLINKCKSESRLGNYPDFGDEILTRERN